MPWASLGRLQAIDSTGKASARKSRVNPWLCEHGMNRPEMDRCRWGRPILSLSTVPSHDMLYRCLGTSFTVFTRLLCGEASVRSQSESHWTTRPLPNRSAYDVPATWRKNGPMPQNSTAPPESSHCWSAYRLVSSPGLCR